MAPEKNDSDMLLLMAMLLLLVGFGLQEPANLVCWFSSGFLITLSSIVRYGIIKNDKDRRE